MSILIIVKKMNSICSETFYQYALKPPKPSTWLILKFIFFPKWLHTCPNGIETAAFERKLSLTEQESLLQERDVLGPWSLHQLMLLTTLINLTCWPLCSVRQICILELTWHFHWPVLQRAHWHRLPQGRQCSRGNGPGPQRGISQSASRWWSTFEGCTQRHVLHAFQGEKTQMNVCYYSWKFMVRHTFCYSLTCFEH